MNDGYNLIRVVYDHGAWLAWIGPDPQAGLMASGSKAVEAIGNLLIKITRENWQFDQF